MVDGKENALRKLTAPGMAALAIVAALLGLWLSGRIAAWMLGQDADGGWGLYLHYLHASRLPQWQPFALRIHMAGALGFGVPLLAWSVAAWHQWRGRPARRPAARFGASRNFSAIGDDTGLLVARQGGRDVRVTGPVLVATPPQVAPDLVIANLLAFEGSAVVLDIGARAFERTSGWRMAQGQHVYRFDPWAGEGRSHGWNPLAGLPPASPARLAALKDIAATLLPDRRDDERFWTSHARNAFVALALWAFEHTPGDEAPTLGAIAHIAAREASRATFQRLHDTLPRGHEGRRAFATLLAQDDGALGAIAARLADPLRPFLDAPLLAATSRHDLRLDLLTQQPTTLYLTVAPGRLAEARPLIALLFQQLARSHAGSATARPCLMLMDGITGVGSIDAYLRTITLLGHEHWRWLTVVPSMDWLRRISDDTTLKALFAAHRTCLVEAPDSPERHADGASLLTAFRQGAPAPALELRALRPGERLLCDARLPLPLRCRRLHFQERAAVPPVAIPPLPEGDPMKLSLRLAAAVASTALTAATFDAVRATDAAPTPATSSAKPYTWEGYSDKPVEAKLGPYRFRFPMNMYYDQMGPDFQGGVSLVLRWPSLEPYPPGENFHDDDSRFLSAISIELTYPDRLSDEEYSNGMRHWIQPRDPGDPKERENPSENLELRIKGDNFHGLTPYYLDFKKLKPYFDKIYGPETSAASPDNSLNKDWYVKFGKGGIPTTFIECTAREVPDGTIVEDGKVLDDPKQRRRASCNHVFDVPEYRLHVLVSYVRPLMKDWAHIEARVRTLLHQYLQR